MLDWMSIHCKSEIRKVSRMICVSSKVSGGTYHDGFDSESLCVGHIPQLELRVLLLDEPALRREPVTRDIEELEPVAAAADHHVVPDQEDCAERVVFRVRVVHG